MHNQSTPEAIRARLLRDRAAIDELLRPSTFGLVLERLPDNTYAWLRPSTDRLEDDDALFVVTDCGRAALDEYRRSQAMQACFGRPWPTVADVASRS
jgi:hypothetical protein